MNGKGIYRYEIIQRDVDFTNACSHVSLMNHILQAAGDDADLNGFGIGDLNVGNCSWVISRMCTRFGRRPAQGETITVCTWVSDIGRLMTTRNMEVTDTSGQVVARTVTQWAVIDIGSRHAVDIRSNIDCAGAVRDEPSPIDPPVRIPRLEGGQVDTKTVLYSDTDFNRHMNAMKYLEWVIDNIPVEELVSGRLERIDVNFLKEAVLGSRLSLHGAVDGRVRRFEIRQMDSAESLCRCAVTFAEPV